MKGLTIIDEELMYKKDDYIAFMTKQPHEHLNEMFGYNDLTENDFKKKEYKGIIMDVSDTGYFKIYFVKTLIPLDGFFCMTTEDEILRPVDLSEIEEERKKLEEQVPRVFVEKFREVWG